MKPVPLDRLGEYLRDGVLVDMRVLHGEEMVTLERVRITEIVIRQYDEALTCKQEFIEGEQTLTHDLIVECDCLYWARPTNFTLDIVNPVKAYEPEPESLEDMGGAVDAAWAACADVCDVVHPVDRWRESVMTASAGSPPLGHWNAVDVKHLVALTAWHTSNLSPDTICKLLGYRSPMPFMTAMDKCHVSSYAAKNNDDWAKREQTRARNWTRFLKEAVNGVLAHGGTLRDEGRRTDRWAYKSA